MSTRCAGRCERSSLRDIGDETRIAYTTFGSVQPLIEVPRWAQTIELSREDFGRYWTTVHAEKAKKVPGISRYVINLAPDLSGSGRELPYDGFAEVWFESEEAMRLSGCSPEARATLDDERNLFDLSTRFSVIVHEHIMIG